MNSKILILNWRDVKNPSAGGGDIIIHKLAKYLADSGLKTQLLCSSFPNSKPMEVIDGVQITRYGNEKFLPFIGFWFFIKNLNKKPDLIIEVINILPWFVSLYSKVPHIVLIHQTQSQLSSNSKTWSITTEFNFFSRRLIIFLERLIPFFYKNVEFITLSNTMKKDISLLGINPEKIHVVEPGIDEASFSLDVTKTKNPTIVYLGRLKKYKGLQYLFKSLVELKKSFPDIKLNIIGKGDYEGQLRKLVKSHNLMSNVEFFGFVTQEEKTKILKSSWFLVIPSLNEGWCIPVIEAGALGIPTVAFANGGLNDSIKNNETGQLVESENVRELSKKIRKLIEDEDLRNRLGENARKYSKSFQWPIQLEKYLKLVKSVI